MRARRRSIGAAVAAVFAVLAALAVAVTAQAQDNPGQPPVDTIPLVQPERPSKVATIVADAIAKDPDVELIVVVAGDNKPDKEAKAKAKASQLGGDWSFGDTVLVRAGKANLKALEADPSIVAISANVTLKPLMSTEAGYVGASTPTTGMWAQGYTGAGMLTAIFDSGFDFTHPAISGQDRIQYCYAGDGSCPGGVDGVTGATGSTVAAEVAGQSHGTGTSSIIASKDATEKGIAYGGKLIAGRVSNNTGSAIPFNNLRAALAWLDSNTTAAGLWSATSEPVGAVSMSIGLAGSEGFYTCGDATMQPTIDSLRVKGIAIVGASGNQGLKNGLPYPACLPGWTAVGRSSNNTTNISAETNMSAWVDVLTPGTEVAARPVSLGGGFTVAFGGTSSATPQAAAAYTLLRQAVTASTLDQREEVLSTTGSLATDQRAGGHAQARRMDIPAAKTKLATAYATAATGKYITQASPVVALDTGATGGQICAGCTRAFNFRAVTGVGELRAKAAWATMHTYSSAANGYVTTWAAEGGGYQPVAVADQIRNGKTTSNAVLLPVTENGAIYVYATTAVHVRFDITGYMGANASDFIALPGAARVVSNLSATVGTEFASPVIPGATFASSGIVNVTFPAGTTAIIANVNVGATAGVGNITRTYGTAGAPPTPATVINQVNDAAWKLAVIKLDGAGKFYYKLGLATTSISIDVLGYLTGTSSMVPLNPVRVANSSSHTGSCWNTSGVAITCTTLTASSQVDITYGGLGGIPANALGVFADLQDDQGFPSAVGAWKIWQQGATNTLNGSVFFNTMPPTYNTEPTNEPIAVGLNPANGRLSLYSTIGNVQFYADAEAYFPI